MQDFREERSPLCLIWVRHSAVGSEASADLIPHFFAAIGFVCVFAAAINTPITAIVLGIEVFGASAAPYFVLAVLISFIASGNTTIYPSQKFPVDKSLFHFQKK